MNTFLLRADDVLRGESRGAQAAPAGRTLQQLVRCVLVFGLIYGGAMGTFGGVAGDRAWQVVYSAIKVPWLLLVTFALSLPSFYILNTLSGLSADFDEVLQALLSSQAGLSIILAALAPFTLVWYSSSSNYQAAIMFNFLMFAVASLSAQWLLRRAYRPLIARHERHLWMLRLWLLLYGFVAIQMAYILRPFVGNPAKPTTLFRPDSWGNAYEVLARTIWGLMAS